jgi:hypothetical protein
MREPKARAYDVLNKINNYMQEYTNILDKPRRKYMRDMILGSIRSNYASAVFGRLIALKQCS